MKDLFCAYYTNSEDITSYMVKKLGVADKDLILEPSAGEGVFVDGVLREKKQVHIDALDINEQAVSVLQTKYKDNPDIIVRKTDTLLDEQLDLFHNVDGHYTKVIGNPPYGAWQDYEKRDILKRKYAGQYVKETYSLFLLRCMSLLKMRGRLSFIIPDTYLFLNMHSRLREVLLTFSKIDEILIFPSKFFPGVSFGYSNLSIITLERCEENEARENVIKVVKGFRSSSEFELLLSKEELPEHLQTFYLKQKDVFANDKHRFVIAENDAVQLLTEKTTTLGDVADIVTGFYTGDNLRFIKALNKNVKGAKNYDIIDEQQIYECTSLQGIPTVTEGYIPYIKSSSNRRYVRESDEWFVRWDEDTIKTYNGNRRSRFQNSAYYFKTGVGIPMVKARTIRAFIMKNHVFDQSIVGIFPKDENKLLYILALMNSDAINRLIHTINPTANNSANYVKQLPYYEPNENTLNLIADKVNNIIMAEKNNDEITAEKLHKEVNNIIDKVYSVTMAA